MKGNIQKKLALAMTAVFAFGLSACDSGGKESGGTPTGAVSSLRVDMHSYMPTKNTTPTPESPTVVISSRLIADAYTKETGVAIKWADSKPTGGSTSEVSEWFINQIRSENCPAIGFSWGTRFQERDYYVDLTEYLERPNHYVEGNVRWKDMFYEYLWSDYEICNAKGEIVAIPITLNPCTPTGIYYNADLFEEQSFETPKNWEDYIELIEKIENCGKTPIVPWGNNKSAGLDQWVFEYSLSPMFAKKLMTDGVTMNGTIVRSDYDGDGRVSTAEEIRGVLEGLYNPEIQASAKLLYSLAKDYYSTILPGGWQTTDYTDRWNAGNIGMMENGLWNMLVENNKTSDVRAFDFGIFAPAMVDSRTTSYASDFEMIAGSEVKSRPSLMLNIMKPAVEGNEELLEQAVDFLMWLTVPDNITMIVEEHGGSLGAVKGTSHSALLDGWLSQEFPEMPDCKWPLGFTTAQNSIINRKFVQWINSTDPAADEEFYRAINEAQRAGAMELVEKLGIDTTGWNI